MANATITRILFIILFLAGAAVIGWMLCQPGMPFGAELLPQHLGLASLPLLLPMRRLQQAARDLDVSMDAIAAVCGVACHPCTKVQVTPEQQQSIQQVDALMTGMMQRAVANALAPVQQAHEAQVRQLTEKLKKETSSYNYFYELADQQRVALNGILSHLEEENVELPDALWALPALQAIYSDGVAQGLAEAAEQDYYAACEPENDPCNREDSCDWVALQNDFGPRNYGDGPLSESKLSIPAPSALDDEIPF